MSAADQDHGTTFDKASAERIARTTGAIAMGMARFFYLSLGAVFFVVFGLIGLAVLKWIPTTSRDKPIISWPAEPLAAAGSSSMAIIDRQRGREEGWLFGGPDTNRAFAALILWQKPEDEAAIARRSTGLYQISSLRELNPRKVPNGPTYDMFTRYGRFTGSDFVFSESDGRSRSCIYFNSMFDVPDFNLKGFYCAPGGQPAGAGPLACLLDNIRIEPTSKTTDAAHYLLARANASAMCSHKSFYPSSHAQPVRRNRRGGVDMRY